MTQTGISRNHVISFLVIHALKYYSYTQPVTNSLYMLINICIQISMF